MTALTALVLLLTLPIGAAPVIYLAGRITYRKNLQVTPARWLATLTMIGLFIPLYTLHRQLLTANRIEVTVGQIHLAYDGISQLIAVSVVLLGFCCMLYSTRYMRGEAGEEKFYALLSIMIGAILGLATAGDLFNLWVWFEVMSISSYLLVAFYRDQADSIEAGVKYLVQSAAGSVFILLGIAIVFSQSATLDLTAIKAALQNSSSLLLLAASVLFFAGFGIKAAIVPMHTWLPDAHSQAPSGISAMLSGVVIEAGLTALLRVLPVVIQSQAKWGVIFLLAGSVNLLLGNLMALRQNQVKRLLAYSSVSQMGYILIGFGAAMYSQQPTGASGSFFHILTHALMKGLAFLAAGSLLYGLKISRHDHTPLMNEDLNGVSQRYPLTALMFSTALLALGGLPPMVGFWSKWQIFLAGFEGNSIFPMMVVIFAAINSVLSLGYYAPLVNRMYRLKSTALVSEGTAMKAEMVIPMALLFVMIVVIGLWPSLTQWLISPAAASFLAVFGG